MRIRVTSMLITSSPLLLPLRWRFFFVAIIFNPLNSFFSALFRIFGRTFHSEHAAKIQIFCRQTKLFSDFLNQNIRIMEKTDINRRFITAINTLLKDKGLTKTGIAQSLGIKPSKFSEILNERMNVGTDTLALVCELYSFNPSWLLLGEGSMLIPGPIKGRSKPAISVEKLPDFPLDSEGVCKFFIQIMRDKDLRFAEQAEEIGKLKARIEELERHRGADASDAGISGVAHAG